MPRLECIYPVYYFEKERKSIGARLIIPISDIPLSNLTRLSRVKLITEQRNILSHDCGRNNNNNNNNKGIIIIQARKKGGRVRVLSPPRDAVFHFYGRTLRRFENIQQRPTAALPSASTRSPISSLLVTVRVRFFYCPPTISRRRVLVQCCAPVVFSDGAYYVWRRRRQLIIGSVCVCVRFLCTVRATRRSVSLSLTKIENTYRELTLRKKPKNIYKNVRS